MWGSPLVSINYNRPHGQKGQTMDTRKHWLTLVRQATTRVDDEIYCFASPSENIEKADRYPYAPCWVDLDHGKARRPDIRTVFNAPIIIATWDEMVGEWDMSPNNHFPSPYMTMANRLCEKIDTIN